MNQDTWNKRYMKIAKEVSTWSSCLSRHVGCVITVDNRIVATGYNGAPAGIINCRSTGECLRKSSKSGESLDMCLATHAEQNALIQAAKLGISVNGGRIYCTTKPCATCIKLIINAGIKSVYYLEDYNSPLTDRLTEGARLLMFKMEDDY